MADFIIIIDREIANSIGGHQRHVDDKQRYEEKGDGHQNSVIQ